MSDHGGSIAPIRLPMVPEPQLAPEVRSELIAMLHRGEDIFAGLTEPPDPDEDAQARGETVR